GRAGYWLCLPRPRLTADMRLMIRRIVPGAIGAGIYQINLVVDMIIASFLPAGSISYLFFADRVTQLPLGIIGVGVGTALLPLMSRQLGAGNEGGARDSQNRALEFALFLSLPAAAALMVIAHPVIAILFERGAFTSVQTAATAPALAIYAMGLPAYILVKGLTPGFFARGDTLTPMKLAALAAAVNLVMAISLAMIFKHLGIAMATALSSWLNVILLAWALKRRGFLAPDQRLLGKLWRIIATSALMVALLVYLMDVLDVWLAGNMGARIGGLTMLIGAGFVAYMLLTRLAGCWTLGELKTLLGREAA
ncbi:MAG: lipid II flippase MurJ, partial [Rhodospirillales bacterium]|nr:lipid II flippase MurJ [Rhodospirillales bacterium]